MLRIHLQDEGSLACSLTMCLRLLTQGVHAPNQGPFPFHPFYPSHSCTSWLTSLVGSLAHFPQLPSLPFPCTFPLSGPPLTSSLLTSVGPLLSLVSNTILLAWKAGPRFLPWRFPCHMPQRLGESIFILSFLPWALLYALLSALLKFPPLSWP